MITIVSQKAMGFSGMEVSIVDAPDREEIRKAIKFYVDKDEWISAEDIAEKFGFNASDVFDIMQEMEYDDEIRIEVPGH